ncbi:MAG: hypothetical protein HY721_07770 [Planctomycetes bacterium]|nr:hypothetical protein [Planctomycetota bacterium]
MRTMLRLLAGLLLAAAPQAVRAQGNVGRIFFPVPETVGIWEFNELQGILDGEAIPEGTLIPDLTGQGLDATVEVNGGGDLKAGAGDPSFDDPPGSNRECQRTGFSSHAVRVAVNDDADLFEMAPSDDFSIELYVNRETVVGSANWGILAGTWHSRNLLDDNQGNPDQNGAWYGYGLIRNDTASTGQAEWIWILSPVVDGVPRIGFGQAPEVKLPAFDIPEGRHYVVLSVNRVDQVAIGYVDGVEVARLGLDPMWSFTTPDGYEHARFLMFSGEDDPTRGAYRGSPAGTHLDAVRVQRKAMAPEEVLEVWDNIQAGEPTPEPTDTIRAALTASSTSVVVGQCVRLSGESSYAGAGQTITKHEWKVADGPFEEGAAIREISFDGANDAGYDVTLRVTNGAGDTSVARTRIKVRQPPVAARIAVSLGGLPLPGTFLIVPKGSVLTLDGSQSATLVPANAVRCPIATGEAVPPAPIVQYRWDLDGKPLTTESTAAVFDTAPYDVLGERPVTLVVRNEAGQQANASLKVKVVEAGRSGLLFHNTPETLVHFELSGLPEVPEGSPLPNGQGIEDLSGNGYHATVEANDGGDLVMGPGSMIYDAPPGESREVQRPLFTSHNARLAINDDGDAFEMPPDASFTVELFVNRETVVGSANWGILAGTWHSRNLLDDAQGNPDQNGAWYGYGLIRNDRDANPPNEWSWVLSPVVDGVPRIGFPQDPEQHLQPFFDIPAGRHYVVLSVDRVGQVATGYVDGKAVARRDLPPEWSFTTPDGYEHARFLLFSGEDDPSVGTYRGSPAGTHLDAVRVLAVALTPGEVTENWEAICAGDGADPDEEPPPPPKPTFHRGDADDNGLLQLTDAIRVLGFLFLGQAAPTCLEAGDADDNGQLQLTDAIRILGFLFLGGPPPDAPGPPPAACGRDPEGSLGDLGCLAYTNC